MIKHYNNLSFLIFIPGASAQISGLIMRDLYKQRVAQAPASGALAGALIAVGTLLAITGLGFYAKAKGRSILWGLAGFIGFPGILVLAILKDRSGDPWNT